MLQDLVADAVHGRDDGGVGVADVDRRHVGHGRRRRVHDVGRHAAAAAQAQCSQTLNGNANTASSLR